MQDKTPVLESSVFVSPNAIKCWNRYLSGSKKYITIDRDKIVLSLAKALELDWGQVRSGLIYDGWLSVKAAYAYSGWIVSYEKPDYDEDFKPYFLFRKQ